MADWGYCEHNGPHMWHENYPIALGSRQSPIDINETDCEADPELRRSPLVINYDIRGKSLVNTGAGWKVNMDRTSNGGYSLLEGGPLKSQYRLEQFHCHWGKNQDSGSEHTINGKSYVAELHLVHWNCGKYPNFPEAVDKEDGLAVLGIFLEVGDSSHSEMEKICELIEKIQFAGNETFLESELNPANFLPEKKAYWTYQGSLTTPPLLESVDWIVFKEPIKISQEQLDSFRNLRSYSAEESEPKDEFEGKVLLNFRPTSEKGERTVKLCED